MLYRNGKSSGFSLIELSFIITILSTIALGYISINSITLNDNVDKVNKTQKKMKEIDAAVKSFINKYGRVPCPAKRDIVAIGTTYNFSYDHMIYNLTSGDEYMANTNNVNNVNKLGNECMYSIGAVPTKALNLPENYMLDAWGRKFNFHVSSNLCSRNSSTAGTSILHTPIYNCTPNSYKYSKGQLLVFDINVNNTVIFDAVYVLLSYGANGYGAYSSSGTYTGDPTNGDESINVANMLESNSNFNVYHKGNLNNGFDDIVMFANKNQIEATKHLPSNVIINSTDCTTNSTNLSSMTSSLLNNIRTVYSVATPSPISYYGDVAVLDMMWVLQEVCGVLYPPFTKTCPFGWTYSISDNACHI